MTISKAISELVRLKEHHGEILVYFDCPKCGISYTPDIVVALTAHISAKEKEK